MKHRLFFIPAIAFSLVTNAQSTKTNEKPVKLGNARFYENKGQIVDQNYNPNKAVKYLFNGNGLNVQLRATGFSYDTYKNDSVSPKSSSLMNEPTNLKEGSRELIRHYQRIDVELVGCNTAAPLMAEDKSEAYYNYFTAGAPQGGISEVHTYKKVTYKNIYPNIDLQFFINEKNAVEYNFIVHAGGDYKRIKLQYKGAEGIKLQGGEILIPTSNGNLTENIPLSYLTDSKLPVQVNYIPCENGTFGFRISNVETLNSESDLIIDPTPCLSWGTYYGGTGTEYGYGIALDAADNSYITGNTTSTNNIATAGAYQTAFDATFDVFVAKFNPTGTSLVWGTYYGGTGDDEGYGITLDASDNIYITGWTGSPANIATAGAYKTTFSGILNVFIAKFNPTGTSLLWGTYYGGTGADRGWAITLDASDNVYVAGESTSTAGIATAGAYQTVNGGGIDVIVAKFNPTGTSLLWGTYYGGTGTDKAKGIALDAGNNVYLTGYTASTSGIATAGTYQTTAGGSFDAFIAKFNSTGTALTWGTYYGGTGDDEGWGIALDVGTNVYIVGLTASVSGIATAGAYQTVFKGNYDVIVAKFNPTGTSLLWGTYYGGTGFDDGFGIVLDAADNVYIAGASSSISGISTAGAYQTGMNGVFDAFVAKFNPTGTALTWGTYYGGTGQDEAFAIAMDAGNNIYLTGDAASTTNIATAGTYQTTYGGNTYDAYVAKFGCNMVCTLTGVNISGVTNENCNGGNTGSAIGTPVGGTAPYTYSWTPSGGSSSTASNLTAATYTITVTDVSGCTASASIAITQPVALAITMASQNNVLCNGGTGNATANAATGGTSPYNYTWTPSGGTNLTANSLSAGTYTITATDNHGCTATASATITEPTLLTSNANATTNPICQGSCTDINVNSGGGTGAYTYAWSNGATTTTVNVCPVSTTSYTATVTDANGCTSTASVTVTVNNLPTVTLSAAMDTQCINMSINLLTGNPSGGTYSGPGVTGSNFNANTAGLGNKTVMYTYTDINGCTNSDSLVINVDICAGINKVSNLESQIKFYPNPFMQSINVDNSTTEAVSVTIFNMVGQNMGNWQLDKGVNTISTETFPSDVYMIQVKTKDGVLNKKLIKVN